MKLLIVTQKVDTNDPILSFFHRWIFEFAKQFESIVVICLEEGIHELPSNVRLLSLGKAQNHKTTLGLRFRYAFRFSKIVWSERKEYDAVFVHMNQEYILLAGWLWRLVGKKITMWRNHYEGNILTKIASMFCHKVYCTSAYSYTARFKNTEIMPIGIDLDLFKTDRNITRIQKSILFIARIAPSKRPDLLIEALGRLKQEGRHFIASFVGDPLSEHLEYYESLKKRALELGLGESVRFERGVPNRGVPAIYSRYEVFVNMSPSGMYDKTIFEAMACGCLVLSSNKNLEREIDERLMFKEGDVTDLVSKLRQLSDLDQATRVSMSNDLIRYVTSKHGLASLAETLKNSIESIK